MSAVARQPSRPLQYAKAIRESDLPSGVRAVCWALATYANNDTGEAWPSVKILARTAGLSEAVVSTHTGVAESMGYLRKARRVGTSIKYTITVPVVEDAGKPGTTEAYREAIDRSLLKTPVKNTLHAMADKSAGGISTIDRASLCVITGKRDEGTITAHFKKARAAGLLKSQQRFDKSPIHTLLIPGVDASAQPGSQLGNCRSWTPAEIAWWDGLDPVTWTAPPWLPWTGHEPLF